MSWSPRTVRPRRANVAVVTLGRSGLADAVEVRDHVARVLERQQLHPARQRRGGAADRRAGGDDVGDVELAADRRVARGGHRHHAALAVADQHHLVVAPHAGPAHRRAALRPRRRCAADERAPLVVRLVMSGSGSGVPRLRSGDVDDRPARPVAHRQDPYVDRAVRGVAVALGQVAEHVGQPARRPPGHAAPVDARPPEDAVPVGNALADRREQCRHAERRDQDVGELRVGATHRLGGRQRVARGGEWPPPRRSAPGRRSARRARRPALRCSPGRRPRRRRPPAAARRRWRRIRRRPSSARAIRRARSVVRARSRAKPTGSKHRRADDARGGQVAVQAARRRRACPHRAPNRPARATMASQSAVIPELPPRTETGCGAGIGSSQTDQVQGVAGKTLAVGEQPLAVGHGRSGALPRPRASAGRRTEVRGRRTGRRPWPHAGAARRPRRRADRRRRAAPDSATCASAEKASAARPCQSAPATANRGTRRGSGLRWRAGRCDLRSPPARPDRAGMTCREGCATGPTPITRSSLIVDDDPVVHSAPKSVDSGRPWLNGGTELHRMQFGGVRRRLGPTAYDTSEGTGHAVRARRSWNRGAEGAG